MSAGTPTTSTSSIQGPEGLSFFTKTWTPAGDIVASVIFVHGFVEHIRRYDHVFDRFAKEGIAVFAFDQRGFGQTAVDLGGNNQGVTSWPQQLADISFFVNHVSTLHPNVPEILFGHSMGGALALAFATRQPPSPGLDKIKAIISASPLIQQSPGVKASGLVLKVGSLIGKLSGNMKLPTEVKPDDVSRDPEVGKIYAADPLCKQQGSFRGVSDMLNGGEALLAKDYKNLPKSLPVLLVHGEEDKVTWCEASKQFVEKAQKDGAQIEYKGFPGFYHELHNEPGEDKWTEIKYLTDWIKSKL